MVQKVLFLSFCDKSKNQHTQYWNPSTKVEYTHKHQLHKESILQVKLSTTYFDCHCWFGQRRTYFTHRLILSAIGDAWAGGRHRGIWLWFGVLALTKWPAVDLKVSGDKTHYIFTNEFTSTKCSESRRKVLLKISLSLTWYFGEGLLPGSKEMVFLWTLAPSSHCVMEVDGT